MLFRSTHPAVMGFDLIVIAPLLRSHCGFSFVFGCGVSFLVSSSVFLSMIVQQLVVILVFSQEGVIACPSTLPSWFSNLFHPSTQPNELLMLSVHANFHTVEQGPHCQHYFSLGVPWPSSHNGITFHMGLWRWPPHLPDNTSSSAHPNKSENDQGTI